MLLRPAGALLFFVTAAGGAHDVAARAPTSLNASQRTTASGSIEGVLHVRPAPPRRTASRYGAAAGAVRAVQEIPPVVFLEDGPARALQPTGSPAMAQEDTAFAPALLVVPSGTSVRFPNQDAFFHNVFSYSSAGRFDLGRYPEGQSKDVRFEEAGLVKVYCEVHESMRAAILVVENPFWARPDAEGQFRIADVPAGTYTLVAWHADRGERKVSVTVPAGGVARVELEL